jgi:hypothetical protein
MAKPYWFGGLTVVVIGVALGVYAYRTQQFPVPPPVRSQDAVLATKRDEAKPVAVVPHAPVTPLSAEEEPIATRLESLAPEAKASEAATLPTLSGGEESDADTPRAPRPDVETRRMPYAD